MPGWGSTSWGDTAWGDPAQEVDLGLIDQSGVVFAVHTSQSVAPGIIDQSATTFTPRVGRGIKFTAIIDQHGVLFAPVFTRLTPGSTVTLGLIDQSAVVFQPAPFTLKTTLGIIDQSGTVFAPNVITGARDAGSIVNTRSGLRRGRLRAGPDRNRYPMRVRGLDHSSTLRGGNRVRTPGFPERIARQVALGIIDQHGVVFTPQVNALNVRPAIIDQAGVTFAPDIQQAPMTVKPAIIDQHGVLFAPAINAQFVYPNIIDQSGVVFPFKTKMQTTLGIIDNSATVFAPQRIGVAVVPDIIDNSGVVFDPTVGYGTNLNLLDNSGVLFSPTVVRQVGQSVRMDDDPSQFLDNSAVLFDIGVFRANPKTVSLPTIDQTGVAIGIRVQLPTRGTIHLHAIHQPIITKRGQYTINVIHLAAESPQE